MTSSIQPTSSWIAPKLSDLPNIKYENIIGIDTETHDPNLLTNGPGFLRGESYPVGCSLAVPDGPAIYLPWGHSEDNLPKENVLRYLRDQLSGPGAKVGANILYDIEALDSVGVQVNGPWKDVQIAQPLIADGRVNLDHLCDVWLGESKEEGLLERWAIANHIDPKKVKGHMKDIPARYVGPYAEVDAIQPWRIHIKQMLEIGIQRLVPLYTMESKLLKVIWAMRKRGVRIDDERALNFRDRWLVEENRLVEELYPVLNREPRIWAAEYLMELCDHIDVQYQFTEKGQASFESEWLENQGGTFTKIARLRKLERARKVFVESKMLDVAVNGRIHAQFHPLRNDDYGTASGRFSSSNPNLQQVPADDEFGAAIRSCFLPEEGEFWAGADYAGQELRLATHFAYMAKAERADELVKKYLENPELDLHQMTADFANITRKDAKGVSFCILYGGGLKKLADTIGKDLSTAKKVNSRYNQAVPCFRETADMAANRARSQGHVRTILGRRRRFKNLKGAYAAFNAVIQGSGADMIKAAMLKIYEELDLTPLMTVHDELSYSIKDPKLLPEIKERMEKAVPKVVVPMLVDAKLGKNWAEAH